MRLGLLLIQHVSMFKNKKSYPITPICNVSDFAGAFEDEGIGTVVKIFLSWVLVCCSNAKYML